MNSEEEKVIEAYEAFVQIALKDENKSILSQDELKAVGQKVVNDLIEEALNEFHGSEYEKVKYEARLLDIIEKHCAYKLSDTNTTFDGKQFTSKIKS